MLEINRIYNMDCVDGMKLLDDESIDLVVTSPPYDNLRDYNGFSVDLHSVGVEVFRCLKVGGICVVVIQDQTKMVKSLTSFRTAVDWVDNVGFGLWECCIYYRSGTPGAWWTKRFRVDHEYIMIFLKGRSPKYFDKSHMKMKTDPKWHMSKSDVKVRGTNGKIISSGNSYSTPDEIAIGTIMHYSSSSRETPRSGKIGKEKLNHPATFPDKLASDFIVCFTRDGDLVLDPFMGSGTTARMALKNNRNYIGFDVSAEYCSLANSLVSKEK